MKIKLIALLAFIPALSFSQTNTYTSFAKGNPKVKEFCSGKLCDGTASFYVSHTPTNHVPFSNTQTAHMISSTNTGVIVEYVSSFGNTGCSNGVITWNTINPSEVYIFNVLWPTNQIVPTNVLVGLTAVGFSPSTNTP